MAYLGEPVCAKSMAVTRLETVCQCMGYSGVARVEIVSTPGITATGANLFPIDKSPDPCEYTVTLEQDCAHFYQITCSDYSFWSGLRLHGSGSVRLENVSLHHAGLSRDAGILTVIIRL